MVRFEGYRLEFRPEGKLLVLENQDVPGVVGKVGTLLAETNVNIADIHLAPPRDGGAGRPARVDQEPTPELVEKLERCRR